MPEHPHVAVRFFVQLEGSETPLGAENGLFKRPSTVAPRVQVGHLRLVVRGVRLRTEDEFAGPCARGFTHQPLGDDFFVRLHIGKTHAWNRSGIRLPDLDELERTRVGP